MPCIPLPGGGVACTRGRQRAKCETEGCHKLHEALCDWPIAGGTCSRRMCADHSYHVGGNRDYCFPHRDELLKSISDEEKAMKDHVWTRVAGYDERQPRPGPSAQAFACRCGAWAYKRGDKELAQAHGVELRLGWQDPAAGCGPAPE